ncbi:MAG: threonine synthase [Verrucomicrobia bacterium]|nr:threonine synthase [Verrucomicrobiota bacterium]
MRYISTRGGGDPTGFQDAVMTGLAPDGGLLIPDSIPDVRDRLEEWSGLSFADLSFEVIRLFSDIPDADLKQIIDRSYSAFRHPEVVPTVPVGGVHVMELFHGPTLAFKDVALQFLGNTFEYILERTGRHLNILAATSGDTGSAAIYSVRGREHIQIFVMHPDGKVAPVQERQMTAVLDENVHNIAIKGTFDDCQRIMKSIFEDLDFKRKYSLGAVNSVNWARVLAQIVYYFYSGLRTMKVTGASRVRFAVPTGNFGDILAGWYALRMGLPVSHLVLATNENDILARFFETGEYSLGTVYHTLSPSMDIQVASNFERYLYCRVGQDPEKISAMMQQFRETGKLAVELAEGEEVDPVFIPGVGRREDILEVIRRYHDEFNYVLDPHTAVGVHVAEQHLNPDEPMICLSTAHPAKFSAAITEATGAEVHHRILDGLLQAETRCTTLPNDVQAVRAFVVEHGQVSR